MIEDETEGQIDCRCRCGFCCEYMRIEISDYDAGCDPKIRQRATPVVVSPEPDAAPRWLLNSDAGPCVFFLRDEQGLGCCEIYETRPQVCRMFDCDHANPGY